MNQEKRMTSVQWIWMLIGCIVLIAVLSLILNFIADPYGAFGDRVMDWWTYNETLNPRMAKISYLQKNHNKYDSYIVGSSGSSSYPIDELNEYLDASFYNCMFYGTDIVDFENICNYLIDNYTVRNLLLNLSPNIAQPCEVNRVSLATCQYYKVTQQSPFLFYSRYLMINPMDSIQKIKCRLKDGYMQQSYRCFNEENGSYDKSRRDVEPIGDLDEYLSRDAYRVFLDYPKDSIDLVNLDNAIKGVSRIVKLCEKKGVKLIVTCQPTYYEALNFYSEEDIVRFRNALAQVTDYWDFTLSSISYEPRYFYDSTHFRNSVGTMALARIFSNDSIYVPDDFGEHIEKYSQPGLPDGKAMDVSEYTASIPILMYHHISTEHSDNPDIVTQKRFREHMEALYQSGYNPVSFDDLKSYVETGAELPDKPVVITFDDGYESNYTLAYPIIKEYGFKATIFVIGVSIGKNTYKDTGVDMIPHFSITEAEEMMKSGLITVASHGYDIHEVSGRDPEPIRMGILKKKGESDSKYVEFLTQDCRKMENLLGYSPIVLAYPHGISSELSEVILSQNNIYSTVTTIGTSAMIIKGLPQSLLQLGRYMATDDLSGNDLINMIEQN